MNGTAPEQLNAGNCANPRFKNNDLGDGSAPPADPLKNVTSIGGGGSGSGNAGTGGAGGGAAKTGGAPTAGGAATGPAKSGAATTGAPTGATAQDPTAATTDTTAVDPNAPTDIAAGASGAVGRTGGASAAGGGSTEWRTAAPAAYERGSGPTSTALPLLILLAIVIGPPALGGLRRLRAR